MDKKLIGIIGYKGRLGSQLVNKFGCSPIECDITSIDSIKTAIGKEGYEVIINCAAYTNVDGAEKERLRSYAVNSFGPQNIAKTYNGKIVHISSDYIFDGLNGPYDEDAIANPICGYGFSKYFGEVGLRPYMNRVLIVRTTVLFDNSRPNFVTQVYNQLKENQVVRVPKEIIGNPTHTLHLAYGILDAIDKEQLGILNISGKTRMGRYDTAIEIARFFDLDKKNIQTGPAWGDAKRPERAGFILDKAVKLGIPLYSLWEGLHQLKVEMGLLPNPLLPEEYKQNVEKIGIV